MELHIGKTGLLIFIFVNSFFGISIKRAVDHMRVKRDVVLEDISQTLFKPKATLFTEKLSADRSQNYRSAFLKCAWTGFKATEFLVLRSNYTKPVLGVCKVQNQQPVFRQICSFKQAFALKVIITHLRGGNVSKFESHSSGRIAFWKCSDFPGKRYRPVIVAQDCVIKIYYKKLMLAISDSIDSIQRPGRPLFLQ